MNLSASRTSGQFPHLWTVSPCSRFIVCASRVFLCRVYFKAAGTLDSSNFEESMARSEDCLYCADLQAELEEVRAQQHTLENQVKNLETRMENQYHTINDKYRAEIDLFLHRVASLHEQFRNLSNRCNYAEESIAILQYIMDKKKNRATSSSSVQ